MASKKTASGKYRYRIWYTDKYGTKRQKSFTAKTQKEARQMAADFQLQQSKMFDPTKKNFREAANDFIDSREGVLSPSTIGGYRKMVNGSDMDIFNYSLGYVTKQVVQSEISKYSVGRAPQTVRNMFNLIKQVLEYNNVDVCSNIVLPKKMPTEVAIPTIEEARVILDHFTGTRLELMVKFAMYLGLRKSEILGITWANIDSSNRTVVINKARVKDEFGVYVVKHSTKTFTSTRTLTMPDALYDSLPERGSDDDFVIDDSPAALDSMYKREIVKLGMSYNFHALRHFYASVMLRQGVQNRYAKERMGHSTENMLQRVYQHTFKDVHSQIDDTMNEFFNDNLNNS